MGEFDGQHTCQFSEIRLFQAPIWMREGVDIDASDLRYRVCSCGNSVWGAQVEVNRAYAASSSISSPGTASDPLGAASLPRL